MAHRTFVTDVNIDNEQFNRRYRVTRLSQGAGLDAHAFRRYATAVLTPRVAEALLATKQAQVVVAITGDRLLAIVVARPDLGETVADTLIEVARAPPRQVYTEHGRG